MKKINTIAILCCMLLATAVSFAQNDTDSYQRNLKFGVGLNAGAPFNKPYNFNAGADVRLQYNISETYSLTFTTGYNSLFVDDNEPNYGYVPVKVGYKTFLFSNEIYVMGEIGGAFSTTKNYPKNSMLFCPSIGYAVKKIDLSLRYEFLKDFPIIKDGEEDHGLGQIMIRVAYGLNI